MKTVMQEQDSRRTNLARLDDQSEERGTWGLTVSPLERGARTI
jgi:hypothetical protein